MYDAELELSLTISKGFQSTETGGAYHSTDPVSTRRRSDLSGHAGQSPPALPQRIGESPTSANEP